MVRGASEFKVVETTKLRAHTHQSHVKCDDRTDDSTGGCHHIHKDGEDKIKLTHITVLGS
jgi:hypothetical protein